MKWGTGKARAAKLGIILGVAVVALATGAAETVLSVHFIDVGQGDAILIDYGTYELLIDGGRSSTCASYITPYIQGNLEAVVATHMDADHIGGLDEVFESFAVDAVWINGNTADTQVYRDFRDAYLFENCDVETARRDGTVLLGDLGIEILHPAVLTSDRNQNSVVLRLSINGADFLFTGDIDSSVETQLLSLGLISGTEVLKVAHHGSRTATSAEFLGAVDPLVCVISVSATNQHGHPTSDVLNRIESNGEDCLILRTDVHGSIVLSVDAEGCVFYRLACESKPGGGVVINEVEPNPDDPLPPRFVTDKTSLTVPEGGTETVRVKLSSQPASTVNVSVSRSSGDSSISVAGGTNLTFTTSNWSSYQTVTVHASADSDSVNGSATITIHRTSGPSVPDKSVTAREDDRDLYTPCDCNRGDTLNCDDFPCRRAAQECHDHCIRTVGRDVHNLDGYDNDGLACESLRKTCP